MGNLEIGWEDGLDMINLRYKTLEVRGDMRKPTPGYFKVHYRWTVGKLEIGWEDELDIRNLRYKSFEVQGDSWEPTPSNFKVNRLWEYN